MKRAKSQISSTKSQINLNDQNSKSQTLIVESLNSRPSGESRIGSGTGAGVQKLLDHWIALKLHYVPGFSDCVAIDKNLHIAVFVIPVPDQVRDDGPGIQCFFKVLRYWMPDQVRHDGQKLRTFIEL
jgi:hypothetical protein